MNSRFYKKNNKLIYINKNADFKFWDDKWNQKKNWINDITLKGKPNNGFVRKINKFLPNNSIILEAGCGQGQFVHSLHMAGYKVIGVDYAKKTVDVLNEKTPFLDIRYGDVFNLNEFEDSYFDGYYSGGLIEHFWDGYDKILKEANRVLKKKGFIFISCPIVSKRKINFLKYVDEWHSNEIPDNFYQFSLCRDSLIKKINNDFEIKSIIYENGIRDFIDLNNSNRLITHVYNNPRSLLVLKIIKKVLNLFFLKLGYAHNIFIVAQKK